MRGFWFKDDTFSRACGSVRETSLTPLVIGVTVKGLFL